MSDVAIHDICGAAIMITLILAFAWWMVKGE